MDGGIKSNLRVDDVVGARRPRIGRDSELVRVIEGLARSQELSLRTLQAVIDLLGEQQAARQASKAKEEAHDLDARRKTKLIARGLMISSEVAPEHLRGYLRGAAQLVYEFGEVFVAPEERPTTSADADATHDADETPEPEASNVAPDVPLDLSFSYVAPEPPSERERLLACMDDISPYIAEPLLDALAVGREQGLARIRGYAHEIGAQLEQLGLARRFPTTELRSALRALEDHSDVAVSRGARWTVHFDRLRS